VHGEPFSTTSHRTFLARQQQHAFEARRLTGRELAESPAVEALRLLWDSVSMVFVDVGVDDDTARLVIVEPGEPMKLAIDIN
jgi:hypothetical protein